MSRIIEHDDRIRVRAARHPSKDELVFNLYKYVDNETFVYDANKGRWQHINPGDQHEPSFVFQGITAAAVVEAFRELDQTSARVRAELLNENERLGTRVVEAEERQHEAERQVRQLLDLLTVVSGKLGSY